MKAISLNKTNAPLEGLARATAKVSLEFAKFAKSTTVNTLLALVAVARLMCWLLTDGQAGSPAAWCVAWAIHFAVMSAIDIKRKGGEL